MVTLSFVAFVGLVVMIAVSDWRRAWPLAILVGVLQDPVRKLAAGTPTWISMSIIPVVAMIVLAQQLTLQREAGDFTRRFRSVWSAFALVLIALAIATLNGIATFGLADWKGPVLSLFLYLLPVPAIMIGYAYVDRDEAIDRFLLFYSVLTSLALVGSLLEFMRVDSRAFGMVAQSGDYIRFMPGLQIRMISGFYRGPDIMAAHAAMLTSIGLARVVHAGASRRVWLWMFISGWGFFNCMISGRRKAIYFVLVFVLAFIWRYFRRLNFARLTGVVAAGLVIFGVVHYISRDEGTSVYARGAAASRAEFAGRLEGGMFGTISQSGFMGAGLGTATQGVYHVVSSTANVGWQEGGLGKLTLELGVPGLLAIAFFFFVTARLLLRITAFGDEPASSQINRVTLFALVVAHVANFVASAQTYSDPVVSLLAAFFVGALFATAALEDRERARLGPGTMAPHRELAPVAS